MSTGAADRKALSLRRNTRYYWQVRAVYLNGTTHYSPGWSSFRTRP